MCNKLTRHVFVLTVFMFFLVSCGGADRSATNTTRPNLPTISQPLEFTDEALHNHATAYPNLMSALTTPPALYTTAALDESSVVINKSLKTQAVDSSSPIEMRILLISALTDDPGLAAMEKLLNSTGTPYDVFIASTTALTSATLMSNATTGKYQGIILTNAALTYDTGGGNFLSAFTADEWNILWQYERDLGVRQVALFTNPTAFPEDYGVRSLATVSTTEAAPLNTLLTDTGKSIFTSVNPTATIPIELTFAYPSEFFSTTGTVATPLLQDTAGRILGVLSPSIDGRERIALMMGHNTSLLHTQLFGYDLLRWVTKGVFVGERRVYMNIDIDDWYLTSDLWDPVTNTNLPFEVGNYRITAQDALATRDGILDIRNRFGVPSLIYNQVFNAAKAIPGAQSNCSPTATLSEMSLCLDDFFYWISHTYTHAEMDFLTYAQARAEFEQNINFAESTTLDFGKEYLVTGKVSGLGWYRIADAPAGAVCQADQVPNDEFCQFGLGASNTEMLRAAQDLGIRYVSANRGWATHEAPCPNCGFTHPLNSEIYMIPRWPTNIYFNTNEPFGNLDEFNHFYGPQGIIRQPDGSAFFSTEQSFPQLLEFEAEQTFSHMMDYSAYPHFFHQNNLFEYAPGRHLIYDWLEATLTKYNRYAAMPVISQNWPELTQTIEEKTSAFFAQPIATWNRADASVSIQSAIGGTVFVTGVNFTGASVINYNGDSINKITLNANQSLTGVAILDPVTPSEPPATGNLLVNSDFTDTTAWTNCGSANSFDISGGFLNISSGACVFQNVNAIANTSYTLSCVAKSDGASWNTLIITAQDANFNTIGQLFTTNLGTSYEQISVTLAAPSGTAYMSASFYSEGEASYSSCDIRIGTEAPANPVIPTTPTTPTTPTVPTGNQLLNPSFDTTASWSNCANASNFNITGGNLNILPGACVFQTVEASPSVNYTLSCNARLDSSAWSTLILSSLDANFNTISSDFVQNASTSFQNISVALTAPSNASHMAVGFYTEGQASYSECSLEPTSTSSSTNLLQNGDFNSSTNWTNCGAASSYTISGGSLNITPGVCLFQTASASANTTYTLSCVAQANDANWSTFSLIASNASFQTLTQDFTPLDTNLINRSITIVAPAGTANIGIGFYTEGSATYESCTLFAN